MTEKDKSEQNEEEELTTFLQKHNVKNPTLIVSKLGVGLSDLLEYREKDLELKGEGQIYHNTYTNVYDIFKKKELNECFEGDAKIRVGGGGGKKKKKVPSLMHTDICKEAGIGALQRADLIKALRNVPESCVYRDWNKTYVVVVVEKDQEKMNRLQEKYKHISMSVNKLETAMAGLEENSNGCKQKVEKAFDDLVNNIRSYEKDLLLKIDLYKNDKKEILSKQLSQLQFLQQKVKSLSDALTECMTNPKLEAKQRKGYISKLLEDPLIDQMKWDDTLAVSTSIHVNTDFEALLQVEFWDILFKQLISVYVYVYIMYIYIIYIYIYICIVILENNSVKLNKTTVKYSKGNNPMPCVCLQWTDDIHDIWKGKCVLEVEMKSVSKKKKKDNEIDEKKSNDIENTNASSSSSISIGSASASASASVSAITAAVTGWAKVADILCHENKSNTAVIKHDSFRISDQYLFRMRGCFTNRISFTPYSNVQL
ncbi:hypothetical protein RFI_06038, partial [Reticulomyxa filosa]